MARLDHEDDIKARQRLRVADRKREARDEMSARTDMLDAIVPGLPDPATASEVRIALGIRDRRTLHKVLEHHSDEMRAGGWNPNAGTFTRESVVRLCLLLRSATSPTAAAVAEAVGGRDKVIRFAYSDLGHVRRCQSFMVQALEYAERVQDEDPAEVWHDLNQMDGYTLKAVFVALAAMLPVDIEQSLLTEYLCNLSPSLRHPGKGAASGLSMLVPPVDQANNIPLGKIPSLCDPFMVEADVEAVA